MLLVARAGDAHVHLCFDGSEPAQALHVDGALLDHHDEIHATSVHHDVDVDAVDAALAKKIAQGGDVMPLMLATMIIAIVDVERRTPQHHELQNPSPALPDLFLPLLRGPPV